MPCLNSVNQVERLVSGEMSTRKVLGMMPVTVRHAPLTEMLSELRNPSSPTRTRDAAMTSAPFEGL